MELSLNIGNQSLTYTLSRYKRSKHIRIFVKDTGQVKVTAPLRASQKDIDKAILMNKDWVLKKIEEKKNQYSLFTDAPKAVIKNYKKQSLALVLERLTFFNQIYNFTYNKVTIRNQETRWGSCSSSGTLSFNYKLLFLPAAQRDYVIIHELCHLKEMNHSSRFWKLVEKGEPNYKKIRKELRNRSRMLSNLHK